MIPHWLRVGTRLTRDGKPCCIAGLNVDLDQVILLDDSGDQSIITASQFLDMYYDEHILPELLTPRGVDEPTKVVADFSALPEAVQQRARRRETACKEVADIPLAYRTWDDYQKAGAKVGLSAKTVSVWLPAYERAGCDIRALVDHNYEPLRSKSHTSSIVDPENWTGPTGVAKQLRGL